MKEHVCKLKHTSYPTSTSREDLTLKETLKRLFEINANTPGAKQYFYSQAAVRAEKRKQESLGLWWVVHPFSSWRILWDLMMTVIFMIAFLSIPFTACFINMSHDMIRVDSFNLLIYAFCWLDILCNCMSGYYDVNEVVVELAPRKIFIHYLRTFLLLDVISSIPWDHVTLPWRRLPGDDAYHLVGVVNLLNCLKLTRYGYVNSQILQIFQVTKVRKKYRFPVGHHGSLRFSISRSSISITKCSARSCSGFT
ncbi:potassium/sodium hyperpolarization-activated cyclic nucleotide-gated channel 3-like [Ceratina calcarata]|uniref:Potassium/sodium hyperpolarization-activated cyclic nucleotide-gated channel 3-like n=1 Tax=Ceratina calcarata TaxID=156304 RepID=A0AAJ7SAI4_9HYME|nr:potassium/sodium hyperpolarization-activated cyclic nucleotide-gated channel 3-like [Ceratina calcarata]